MIQKFTGASCICLPCNHFLSENKKMHYQCCMLKFHKMVSKAVVMEYFLSKIADLQPEILSLIRDSMMRETASQ